ncbi:hypothetical protein [Pseudoalteromonas sp.]|uniref:hypothetical protein n=1 Tax=Pseudoalteromonas sp. TaxID=53249 RepID=UPI003563408B
MQQRIDKQNEVLKELALSGHVRAQDIYLERLLDKLRLEPKGDIQELQYFLEWATIRGKENATYRLGYLYLTQPNMPREKGLELIARAAMLGNEKAISDFTLLPGLLSLPEQAYIDAYNSAYRTLSLKQPLDCESWVINCDASIHKLDFSDNIFFSQFKYHQVTSLQNVISSFQSQKHTVAAVISNSHDGYQQLVTQTNVRKLSHPMFNKKPFNNSDEKEKNQRHQSLAQESNKLSDLQRNMLIDKQLSKIGVLLEQFNRYRLPSQQIELEQLIEMIEKGGFGEK